MATPFTLQGTLSYPPDDGQPNALRVFSSSGSYVSKQETEFNIASATTLDIPFGTVIIAKVLLIEVAQANTAAISIAINGSTDEIDIVPGGIFLFVSPTATTGITSLSITTTGSASGSVRILG